MVTIGLKPVTGKLLLYQQLTVYPDAAAEGLEAEPAVAAAAEARRAIGGWNCGG
jgi:hypothetical protein